MSHDGAVRASALTATALIVAAYLGEVGRLELQGEFHQGVCNVGSGFVGDGVIG
jgi:hypothetical protein